MKIQKYLFLFFILNIAAAAVDVDRIIERSEKIMRGDSMYVQLSMKVTTPRWKREIRMQSWSKGEEKSFIKIIYPRRDKGTTFLKIGNEMWQYIPKVERTIKIPPSMMLQSWMGSDFTNDDLVKESSIVDDYEAVLVSDNKTAYLIELIPTEDAAVAWGRLMYEVNKKTYLPTKVEFYDEDDILVRIMEYKDVRKLEDRYFPFLWTMEPLTEDKEGHLTVIKVEQISINKPVKSSLFSLRALKTMSK